MDKEEKEKYRRVAYEGWVRDMMGIYRKLSKERIEEVRAEAVKHTKQCFWVSALLNGSLVIFCFACIKHSFRNIINRTD